MPSSPHHLRPVLSLLLVASSVMAVEQPAHRFDAGATAATAEGLTLAGSLAHGAGQATVGTLALAHGTAPITGLVDLPVLPEVPGTVGDPLNRLLTNPWTESGTWTAVGLPSGVSIVDGALAGTPTTAGNSTVRLRYTTAAGLYTEQEVTLQVAERVGTVTSGILIMPDPTTGTQRPAVAADLTMDLTAGSRFAYRLPVPRGTTVVYTGLPLWAEDEGEGLLTGTVGALGTTIVQAVATLPDGVTTTTTTLTMRVLAPVDGTNGPVVLEPVPRQLIHGEFLQAPLVITGDATDVEFQAEGLPPGTAIDPRTGNITGEPTLPGSYLVRIWAVQGTSGTRAAEGTVLAQTIVVITVLPKIPANPPGSLPGQAWQDVTGQRGCGLGSGLAALLALAFLAPRRRRGQP